MRITRTIAGVLAALSLFVVPAVVFGQYTFVYATVKDPSGNLYAKGAWQVNLNTSGIPPGRLVTFQDSTSFQTAFSGQMNTSGNFSISLPDNNVIEPSGTQWTFGFCEHYSTELQSPSGVCFNLTLPITGSSMDITSQVQAAAATLPSTTLTGIPNPLNTVAIQDKGGQVFNVLAYGAKCDGSTDDTTSIQAAITAAAAVDGTAFVPAGANPCVIASFLTLPGSMTLSGAGNMAASGSSLKFTGVGGGVCTDAQAAPVNTGFIRFSSGSVRVTGLTLQVTNAAAGSCLFNLQDGAETSGVEIDHNNILGGSATTDVNTAIFLYSVDTIRIHNNVIKDWGQMIVGGAHTWANVLIDHNVISTGTETSKAMIQTPVGANCFSSRISGNVFEGYQSTNGISTTCSNGITISNNYMGDSSATGGTWIAGKGTLIDNYIDGSGQLGSGGQALSGSFTAIGNWIYGKSLITVSGNVTGNTFLSGPSAGCFVTMNQSAVVISTGNNFTTSGSAANSYCHANGLTPHPVVISNQDTDATTGGIQTGVTVKYNGRVPGTVSTLPTCSADTEGNSIPVTDSTTNTTGVTITGGGTSHVNGYCNGTNWVVSSGVGGGSGTPGGSSGQVQINNAGAFGGAANLTYDSASGSTTLAVSDKGGQVFNVKAYGAKGDGSTDDTTAIQNALNAIPVSGGTLFFPVGNYEISASLTHSGAGLIVLGAGSIGGGPGTASGAVNLDCTATGVTTMVLGTINTFTYVGPIIKNVSFRDNSAGKTCAGGLQIINDSYPLLQSVGFQNFSKVGVAAPAAPTLTAGTSGSLASATYNVEVSYNTPSGESVPSANAAVAVTGPTGSFTVTSPAASGNATSYNVYIKKVGGAYYLQNQSTGPTTLGTNAVITTQLQSGYTTLNYDESGAFGLEFLGSLGGYGTATTAFVNQPTIIQPSITPNVQNGIVMDRSVATPTILGGNFDMGGSGCGVIVGGGSNLQTHFEAASSFTGTRACLEGFGGRATIGLESAAASSFGIKGIGLNHWNINFTCSSISTAGSVMNMDSNSAGNLVWGISANGSCASPMIIDNGTGDTVYDDSASANNFQLGAALSLQKALILSATTFSALPACSGDAGDIRYITDSTEVRPGVAASGGGTTKTFVGCNATAWNVMSGAMPADVTTTVGTTAIAANTCTATTTVGMTGLLTSMTLTFTATTDTSGVTGWGATGGLVVRPWPSNNTVNYKICNQTASSITPTASVTFNISAR